MVVKIEKERREENNLKNFWDWLWNSESIWSYLVFLVLVFIIVKFIFLPGLSFIFQTSLPLAIVESSSMDHYSLQTPGISGNSICGKTFENSQFFNKDEYWATCGDWYTQNTNITKEEFNGFNFNKDIQIGDVLIFNGGRSNPIIHRVISLNPIQTKGDHNSAQLPEEKNISPAQIIGVAKAKVPYVGWVKLFFVELFSKLKN
jgi:hypothetical protein